MTPEKIYLKGFAGVRDGLHRDEYTLDLTQLPVDAQLVAIAGPNGAGKSTLMDNLHPYRLMPSRATSYSPAGFSFYDHLVLPENVKELTWSHAGKGYRSTLVFRINGKRKSEAYLHQEDGGRWVPVKLADGTLSDGKTETYDACLEGLLGTAEVFFTSQFAAQNRRQLSSYTPGQMKTLMVELLGLEQIRKHGDKASKIVTLLKQTLDERRRNHRSLGDPHAAIQAAMEGLARCDTTARELEQEKGTLAAALLAAQHQVASLTATQDAAADTERRRQVLLASLTQRRQETVVAVEQLRQDQTRETGKIQTAEQALVTARDTAQRQRSQSTKGRESAQAILARQDEILGAKTALAALLQDEEKSLRALETAQAVQRDRDAKEQALAVARTRLDAVRQQAGDAALRAEGLKKRLDLTETVPCRGTDLQPQCRLLSDAHEAKVLMPSVQFDIVMNLSDATHENRLSIFRCTFVKGPEAVLHAHDGTILVALTWRLSANEAIRQKSQRREIKETLVSVRISYFLRLQHAIIINSPHSQTGGISGFLGQALVFVVVNERAMAQWVGCFIVQGIKGFEN